MATWARTCAVAGLLAATAVGCIKEIPLDADAFICVPGANCAEVDASADGGATDVQDTTSVDAGDGVNPPDNPAQDADGATGEGIADAVDGGVTPDGDTGADSDVAKDVADSETGVGPDATPETTPETAGEIAAETVGETVGETVNETVGDAADATAVCPPSCDDGNDCTADDCVKGACVNLPTVASDCDDNNPCTLNDNCGGGKCAGKVTVCPGSGPCLVGGSCNPSTGVCGLANAATGAACDDSNVCTFGDGCKDGLCLPGGATNCDDSNPCTNDSCSHPTGCKSVAAGNTGAACSDGNNCTHSDACLADGSCAGKTLNCMDGNTCTADTCNANTGCAFLPQSATCTDFDFCTKGDACKDGACLPGAPTPCDDINACTTDSCDPIAGCVHQPNTAPCNDNNPCTTDDLCNANKCSPGKYTCACLTKAECDDKNVCTADDCVKNVTTLKFECAYSPTAAACDDGNACSANDKCGASKCAAGTAVVCDDKDPCTDDACSPASGCVVSAKPQSAVVCDGTVVDGRCYKAFKQAQGILWNKAEEACGAWGVGAHLASVATATENATVRAALDVACPGANGFIGAFQVATTLPWAWSDNTPFAYTNWSPNEPNKSGTVVQMLPTGKWDDIDNTKLNIGCYVCERAAPTNCNDGSACTKNDSCANGKCAPGLPLNCDDGNACTLDACNAATGCTNGNVADNTACGNDGCGSDGKTYTLKPLCTAGKCTANKVAPVNCSDGKVCTDDTCDAAKGCASVNNTVNCNDNDSCTDNDVCKVGTCAGVAKVCNDNNVCTNDACTGGACKYTGTPDNAACSGTVWRGHCYEAVKTTGTLSQATSGCTGKNKATLATIASADENEVVRQVRDSVCGVNPAWIGGTQPSATSNDLGWVTGEAATYQNWLAGEPNGLDEVGLEFRPNGLWNDALATTAHPCFVCERPMNVACDDKNACTVGDVCTGGKCAAGPTVECTSKCKASATCNTTTGCPVLAAVTHESKAPAFCDGLQTLICSAGTCTTSKDSACGTKICGFNTKTSDCGKCATAKVCSSAATCENLSAYTKTGATLLPGGAFAMGCVVGDSGCSDEEKPRHVAYLWPFYIDNAEVLYSDYKKCVDTKANAACTSLGLSPEPAAGMPVYNLSHAQALGYCKSKGGTLPTEAQWEYAARFNATTGMAVTTVYPWGNQWPPPAAAIPGNFSIGEFNDGHSGMAPSATIVGIDVVPGTSIVNMLGNLREWCLDPHYTSYPEVGVANPVAPNNAYDGRVVRGGSYKSTYSNKWQGRLSHRAYLNYPVGATDDTVGVRCVYSFIN